MKFRQILLHSLVFALVACSQKSEPSGAATPTAVAGPAAASPAAAAPTAAEAPAQAPDAAPAAPVISDGQSSLKGEGEDFVVIQGGKPYDAVAGKIEVVEFFNYICPACAQFDPLFQEWKAKQPKDVNVVYVPADFSPDFVVYAKAYYAAELLGVAEKSHEAVYKAIHQAHTLPGEGQSPDAQRISGFYTQYGVTAGAFADAMDSFAVNVRMGQGHQYEEQCRLQSTPTLVIAGKYLVKGKSFADMLRIASLLIDRERGASKP